MKTSANKTAVFAGSFDPFTLGHYEIVKRAARYFDKIVVGVAFDTGAKKCVLSFDDRMVVAKQSLSDVSNVEVKKFSGFLVDFAKNEGASAIVRGLRTGNDFEYEKSLSEVYKSQNAEIETFYLISSHNYNHISSSIVRELAFLGGNLSGYVTENVKSLVEKLYKPVKK